MGLFLALSGVINSSRLDVQNVMAEFALEHAGGFELIEGSTDSPNIGVITKTDNNTTILYPRGFYKWDGVARYLSLHLEKLVFSFHIHDGDLWMFIMFHKGEEVGRFNPIPEYWAVLPPEEKAKWVGDAGLISNLIPSVSPDAIARYLLEWDLEQHEELKAYPDDKFAAGDCWQMWDFMMKIGLEYPMGFDGSIQGDTFRFWTKGFPIQNGKPISLLTKPSGPWWKFWQ